MKINLAKAAEYVRAHGFNVEFNNEGLEGSNIPATTRGMFLTKGLEAELKSDNDEENVTLEGQHFVVLDADNVIADPASTPSVACFSVGVIWKDPPGQPTEMISLDQGDRILSEAQTLSPALMNNLQALMTDIIANPDEYSPDVVSSAHFFAVTNGLGAGARAIDEHVQRNIQTAFRLREHIAEIQPDHPDAMRPTSGPLTDIKQILSDMMGHTNVVSGASLTYSGNNARSRGLDAIQRKTFAAITTIPVEKLSCAMVQPDACQQLQAALAGDRVDQAWADLVFATLRRNFSQIPGLGGYNPEMQAFRKDGNDILTVKDFSGHKIYSWPSNTARPIQDIETGAIVVPDPVSDEEVERLQSVYDSIRPFYEPDEDEEDNGYDV